MVSGKGNHPMVMVSWYGAVAYANWRSAMEGRPLCYDLSTWTCNWSSGYRLPTEAEWEKATRGGLSGKRYPWGDNEDTSKANYTGATTAVGSYPPNGYGLYDTAGNVYEFCNDWYAPDYYSTSPYDNPKGPAGPGTMASRVERGGSFFHTGNGLRCAFRNYNGPSSRIYDGGLRLILDAY
ncbi:MAG: SUMF1/EgtB/PvdO family nonheme iron enzyme [Phycisphaerae bacterium]|nr:SUMF1/EgtB/PvdO family nonheme iron enzyme [Phycisphaerae bacterium]